MLAPEVVLPASAAAPINAHLWVMGIPLELAHGATFALVAAPGSSPAPAVDVRVWELSVLVELVPRAPLAASTRFDLWASPHKAPWDTAPGHAGKPVLLGTFRTGERADTAPPSAPVVRRAVRRPPFASCDAWLQIEIGRPTTDAGRDPVLYAVWFADAGGHVAYDAPPEEIVVYSPETESLDVQNPARAKVGLRVGLRALDVAGNLSAPVETTVVAP